MEPTPPEKPILEEPPVEERRRRPIGIEPVSRRVPSLRIYILFLLVAAAFQTYFCQHLYTSHALLFSYSGRHYTGHPLASAIIASEVVSLLILLLVMGLLLSTDVQAVVLWLRANQISLAPLLILSIWQKSPAIFVVMLTGMLAIGGVIDGVKEHTPWAEKRGHSAYELSIIVLALVIAVAGISQITRAIHIPTAPSRPSTTTSTTTGRTILPPVHKPTSTVEAKGYTSQTFSSQTFNVTLAFSAHTSSSASSSGAHETIHLLGSDLQGGRISISIAKYNSLSGAISPAACAKAPYMSPGSSPEARKTDRLLFVVKRRGISTAVCDKSTNAGYADMYLKSQSFWCLITFQYLGSGALNKESLSRIARSVSIS